MKLILLSIAAVPMVFALAPTAAIAAGELGLSSDGVTWGPNLPAPLFDPAFRWVPGDRETASFWVRNQSDGPAVLDVAVLGTAVDSLIDTGDLHVAVEAESGVGLTTSSPGRHVLLSSLSVVRGQVERVNVTVTFDPAATNQSQVKELDLRFEVRLTQDTSGNSDDGGSDSDESDNESDRSDDHGGLPGTGGLPLWALPVGAGLTAAGVALAARERRERTDG